MLLVLLATLPRPTQARLFGRWRMGYHSYDDNTNKDYERYENHTLVCYEHTLRDSQSVDAHRYQPEGSPEYAYSFRFPVSHLEYAELALLEVRWIEFDEVSDANCSDTQREYGDRFRLAWSEFVGWPPWTAFPMPCGTDREQRFGVSMHSNHDWGKHPKTRNDNKVYRAHGGRESADAEVQRINKAHRADPRKFQSIVLTAYMASRNAITVRSLSVRKCLIEPRHPASIEALRGVDAARRAGEDPMLAAALQSVPVALTVDELSPRLLPLRSEVWQESVSGTCFVSVGWVNAWPYTVNASDCHAGNCLQPVDVADFTFMPTHFAPGWHRNTTTIAWQCHGWRPGIWRTLRWVLAHGVVQVDHTTPQTHTDHFIWSDADSADMPPIERYMVRGGQLAEHEINTHIEYWRLAHGHQPQPELSLENLVLSACAINSYDCEKDDDSEETFQAILAILTIVVIGIALIVVIVIAAYIFDFPIDPVKLLYLLAILILLGVGLIGFNFLFASRLNRPNSVERPPNLFDVPGVQGSPFDDLQPAAGLPNVPDAPQVDLPAEDIPSGTFGGQVPTT